MKKYLFLELVVLLSLAGVAEAQISNPLRITCPPDRTNWVCGVSSTAFVSYPMPTATGSCATNAVITCSPPSGALFILGTTTVKCTATNSCRESDNCSFDVTVAQDTALPVIQCPPSITMPMCGTASTVPVTFPTPTATDNADTNVAVTCSPPSGSSFSIGTTTVVCTATDDCSNRSTCTFTVTLVRDVIAPVIQCPSNIVLLACDRSGAVATYLTPTATDNLDSSPDVVCSPRSGERFPVGSTVVACTANDDCNNVRTCTFTVTINVDDVPPSLICPTNIIASICSTCAVSQCVANVPPPIRPGSIGNGLFYGSDVEPDMTQAEAEQAILEREAAGYHPIHINAYQPAGQFGVPGVKFGIAWALDDDSAFPHDAGLATTAAQLQAAEQVQHALRPISISGYKTSENETLFAVAYIYDDSGYPWRLILDRDVDQFYAESVALAQQGYRAISISGYSFDGVNPRYSAIYVQDGLSGTDWIAHEAIPEESYQEWFDAWFNAGYAPVSLCAYIVGEAVGPRTYFAGVMVRVPTGGGYVGRHGLTEDEFLAENAHWTDPQDNEFGATFRPVVVSAYRSQFHGDEKRYVAAWRESAPRTFSSTGVAQPSLAALDTAMENFMKASDINAATLCVSKDGGIVHHRGYTWAPYEFKQTQPCSRFRIASASKAVTAVAIMKLLEGNYFVGMKGGGLQALTLDTPVFQINGMPDLPAAYGTAARGITIRQLLQHRAGWNRAIFDPLYVDIDVAAALSQPLPLSRKQMIDFMMKPSVWPTPGDPASVGYQPIGPGDDSTYSNFGFSILAELIEVVSNLEYETYVRNHVLLPAGASRTYLGHAARLLALTGPDEVTYTAGVSSSPRWYVSDASYDPLDAPNPTSQSVVYPYESSAPFPTTAYGAANVHTIDAAGGWVATSDDLVRMLKSFDGYNDLDADTDTPLLEWDSVWEMWSNPANIDQVANLGAYSLGWQQTTLNTPSGQVRVHYHGGNIHGAFSIIARRSDGVSFAAMFSREAGGGAFTALNNAINTIVNWPVCQDGTIVNFSKPIASDNVDGNVPVSCVPPPGSLFPVGATPVTCTAEDKCGNRQNCNFLVTVKADTTPPSIQCPTNRVVWTCSTNGAVVTFPAPGVDDDSDRDPTIVCVPPSGSLFPVGRSVVTCTATDDCTNRSTCSFTVSVNADTTRPFIVCPEDQTVGTCNTAGVAVNYPAPMVSDNHDPSPSVVCVPPSGSVFPHGVTAVTCTATDSCTNRNVCVFRVTVIRDDAAPTIHCPTNMIVGSCDVNGAVVNYPPPTAAGASGLTPTIVCVPPSGSLFPRGATTVQCSVTNACGDRAVCNFTITVQPGLPMLAESEPNNALASAQDLGLPCFVSVVGRIGPAGDVDYYRFTAPPNSKAWITVDTGGPQWFGANSRDSILTLYNGAGMVLESDDNDGSGNGADNVLESGDASTIAGAALSGGTYYLSVAAVAGQIIAPYRLYVSVATNDIPPEIEPNGAAATATALVSPGQNFGVRDATINPVGDEDWYTVNVPGPSLLHISVDGDPERDGSGTDVQVTLLRQDGVMILFSANSSTSGGSVAEGFVYRLSVPGTYYLRTGSASAAGITGTYRVMVARCELPAPPPLGIVHHGRTLSLSWPIALEPCLIRSSRDLQRWSFLDFTPVAEGGQLRVELPSTFPYQFFQLVPAGGWSNDSYHCCNENGQNCVGYTPGLGGGCLGLVLRCYETQNSSVCEPSNPHE